MKNLLILLVSNIFVTLFLIVPVHPQSVQSRHYRPQHEKCDSYGRCSSKDGYIEEVDHEDDYKSDKDIPPILTRDDWPARPQDGYNDKRDAEDDVEPGGGGGGRHDGGGYGGGIYNPKPTVDRDDDKPVGGGGYKPKPPVDDRDDDLKKPGGRPSGGYGGGGGYKPKPALDIRDDDIKPVGGRPGGNGGGYGGGGHKPKPVVDRDDDIKPTGGRPSGGGGGYGGGDYKPKPVDHRDDDIKPVGNRPAGGGGGYGGGGYKPKPAVDRDDDIKPVGGGGRPSGGGYKPKPAFDRDDDIKPNENRPTGGSRGGYNPKPVVDRDDDYKPNENRPSGGSRGGYNPKPVVDRDDDYKPNENRPSRGGYNPKPDDGDYDIKPARGGGGYGPDDDRKSDKGDIGGYDGPKDDDYNYEAGDDGKYDDYDAKPAPVVEGNCICVPYYQCTDGHIVTDGAGIIDARKKPQPDDELPLDGKFKPPSCGPYHVCCNTPETSTVKPYEHRCGVRNPSGINSRILSPSNKGEADFGEWPWQAAVLKSEGKVNIFQCGGVLIDKYHVLTVAHCVFHLYQLNEYPLKVRLGEWDTQTTTEFLAHEDYRVSKIIIHPEFRNTSLWNDAAILRLQDPVLFAPHIDTVCLPQYDEVFADQNCVVTGWGKDAYKGGTFSNVMKEVALQVIDNYKCEEMLRKTRLGRFFQLHEGFLCAGGEYGLDSCKGDGGGPLVCYRKDKSYALAGIVSWGIDCGQPGVPGVYVKIQKYLDWISKTTGVTLEEYWPKH